MAFFTLKAALSPAAAGRRLSRPLAGRAHRPRCIALRGPAHGHLNRPQRHFSHTALPARAGGRAAKVGGLLHPVFHTPCPLSVL